MMPMETAIAVVAVDVVVVDDDCASGSFPPFDKQSMLQPCSNCSPGSPPDRSPE